MINKFRKTGQIGKHDFGEIVLDGEICKALRCISPESMRGVAINLGDFKKACQRGADCVLLEGPAAGKLARVSVAKTKKLLDGAYKPEGEDYAVINWIDIDPDLMTDWSSPDVIVVD